MSTAFERYWDRIFVINLNRRPDRLFHFNEEMKKIGITKHERFEAIDAGVDFGNHGCSASHRAVLDIICTAGRVGRFFIFEDDATLREPFTNTFNLEVAPILAEIPDDYDMVYFGGHYGEDPRGWFSKHLILMGQMKTTSSYGVTLKSARELRDLIPIGTGDSIDNLYGYYNATKKCLITEPRFFVQYNNYSDLQKRQMNNTPCMEDRGHVERLGNVGRKGARPTQSVPPESPPPSVIIAPTVALVEKPVVATEPVRPMWTGRFPRSKILP